LIETERIGVAPMLRADTADLLLAEICPASTLKRLECYGGYKGRFAPARQSRRNVLARLKVEQVVMDRDLVDRALEEAGANILDAMIAAYAAWHVARTDPAALTLPRDELDRVEARVFF
jgi:hypothetical protein